MSYTVAFTDNSQPGPSGPITGWEWDFGDGGTSTSQNPTHAYSATGNYSVTLTITGTGSDGTATITSSITVVDLGVLVAAFSYSVSGLAVTFTDHSVAGPSGPITGWAWTFGDTNTSTSQNPSHTYGAAGSYTVTLTVTGTSPDGTAPVSHAVTVTTASPNFVSATNAARPAFTPARTVNFTTKAGLDAAIADMTAGDLIRYTGTGTLTITSSSGNAYTLNNKNPASRVVIDFGCSHNIWDPSTITANHVAFRYTGTSSFAAFLVNACSNVTVYGGDYSTGTSGGVGFSVGGATHDCRFWDMYVHDCGTAGASMLPRDLFTAANQNMTDNNVRCEVTNWGIDTAADSHTAAPGTGLHGLLTVDAGGGFSNNTIAVWGHNPTTAGSVLEVGSTIAKGSGVIQNNTFYVKGDHIHFHSTQSCANIVNLWGNKDLSTNVFAWIEGNDIDGAVIRSSSSATITTGMVVQHGRHSGTNLDPSDGLTVPYQTGKGISYSDCT